LYKIESLHQLTAWLISKGISTAQWGMGAAKSLPDLWNEIAIGDAYLEDNPPQRVLNIVDVVVHCGNRVLVEHEQQLSDGRKRYRDLPLSEKIKPGESPVDAAIRGLKEELQVEPNEIKILNASSPPEQIQRVSNSFPGLQTRYVIHKVDVEIDHLPSQDFWTDESQGDHENVTKRHHWRWVDKDV
jgi:hypothetical protein